MDVTVHASIADISADDWNHLAGTDYPFLRHEFLHGLELTGCTLAETGWQPCHLLLREGNEVIAVMPLYLKSHSYGEYVFDWSWAEAWQRSGLEYYPKLVSAIPFTPATGPRLCLREGVDEAVFRRAIETAPRGTGSTSAVSSGQMASTSTSSS